MNVGRLLDQADRRPDRATVACLLAAIAAGTAMRLHDLGSEALWLDEAYSANYAGLAVRELVARLARESTPPLYYVLLGGWIQLFGSGETATRALSALFSIFAVAGVALFVARCGSRRAAAIGAWLAALAPLNIYYAQETRMYSLLALLAVSLVLLAARALERASFPLSIIAAVVTLAALLTHNMAAWLVAGVNIAFVSVARSRAIRTRWLIAQGTAALAYLPWLFVLIEQVRTQHEVLAWFEPFWLAKSWLTHLLDSLASFTLGPFGAYVAISSWIPGAFVFSMTAAGLAGYAAIRTREHREVRFVGAAFTIAMALSVTYSALVQPVHIPGRTDQALMPLFLILVAIGVEQVRPPAAGLAWMALFSAAALAVVIPYYSNGTKSVSRGWLGALAAEVREGDIVVTTGLTRPEAEYYLGRADVSVRLETFPLSLAEHPGYVNYEEFGAAPDELEADARILGAIGRAALAEGRRLFVVLVPADIHATLFEELTDELGSPQIIPGEFAQAHVGAPVELLRFDH